LELTVGIDAMKWLPGFKLPGFKLPGFKLPGFKLPGFKLPGFKWMPESRLFFGGLGLLLLWLGGSNWVSYRNSAQLVESNRQVLRSYEIIQNLTSIYANLTVAESGRRGYVLWGERSELDRYQEGIDYLDSELLTLRQRLSHDPAQSQRFDRMESLVNQRLDLLKQSVTLYQTKGSVDQQQRNITQRNITSNSVKLRNQIQTQLTEMKNLEEVRLRQWLQESQNRKNDRFIIDGWWLGSAFVVVTLGLYVVNEQLIQRRHSEAQREKLLQQKELDALKLQFFSMASHEFRTPLSVILGSSQLLMVSQGDREKVEKNTRRIQAAAKSMTQLLNDILTLVRAEAGSLGCRCDRLELTSFCLNLVEEIGLANSHQHRIQFISRSGQSYAFLDEKLLYLMLSNLLFNAIKYSPSGSEIQLILEDQGDSHLVFIVKDQGNGILEADRPHLYEAFYRGQNTGSIEGTGLGLAVVKTCVDLHQGTISLESHLGVGTAFTLCLPAGKEGKVAVSEPLVTKPQR
jgi:signal transduction histidine kinase